MSGIQTATQETVDAIDNIGKAVNEVSAVPEVIAAGIEEQGLQTKKLSVALNKRQVVHRS